MSAADDLRRRIRRWLINNSALVRDTDPAAIEAELSSVLNLPIGDLIDALAEELPIFEARMKTHRTDLAARAHAWVELHEEAVLAAPDAMRVTRQMAADLRLDLPEAAEALAAELATRTRAIKAETKRAYLAGLRREADARRRP